MHLLAKWEDEKYKNIIDKYFIMLTIRSGHIDHQIWSQLEIVTLTIISATNSSLSDNVNYFINGDERKLTG